MVVWDRPFGYNCAVQAVRRLANVLTDWEGRNNYWNEAQLGSPRLPGGRRAGCVDIRTKRNSPQQIPPRHHKRCTTAVLFDILKWNQREDWIELDRTGLDCFFCRSKEGKLGDFPSPSPTCHYSHGGQRNIIKLTSIVQSRPRLIPGAYLYKSDKMSHWLLLCCLFPLFSSCVSLGTRLDGAKSNCYYYYY